MKQHPTLWLVAFALFALPHEARADAGTPLMWAGMLHLVFGNALIGLGEGALLAWLFSTPKGKSIAVMVLANYVSAWAGGLFLGGAIVRALPMDLNNGWRWFWIMVAATYCMTLVLEWPFIAWCFRGTQGWFRQSVRASLVLQSASYVLLFGWYWMASGTSLYTMMSVVPPSQLALPESVLVYFIAPADGNVYCRRLAGGYGRKVHDLGSTDANDRLFIQPSATDPARWDLIARLETQDNYHPRLVTVLTDAHIEAVPAERHPLQSDPSTPPNTWMSFGDAPRPGDSPNSRWEFASGFWPIQGLRASNKATGELVRFSYETPFGAWTIRNAVQLPGDKALFQLGHDQICAFDPARRRITLLWHGRGPVAVIEKAAAEPLDYHSSR